MTDPSPPVVASRAPTPAPPPRFSLRHVPALDGLRGARRRRRGALPRATSSGGYLGVDLFFALSGFLITLAAAARSATPAASALGGLLGPPGSPLAARRSLVLLVGVALLRVVCRGARRARAASAATRSPRSCTSRTGARSSRGRATGTLFTAPSPLQHTWSLAIEEQFYLRLAVAGAARRRPAPPFRDVRRRRRRVLVLWRSSPPPRRSVLMAPCTARDTTRTRLPRHRHPRFLDPPRRRAGRPARVAGAVAPAALERGARGRRGSAASWCSLWAWVTVDGKDDLLYRGGFAVFAGCAVVVIAAIVHPSAGSGARILFSFPPLRWPRA